MEGHPKIKRILRKSVLISTFNTYQDFMRRRDKMVFQLRLQSQNIKYEWWQSRAHQQQEISKHTLLQVAKNLKYVRKLDMKEFEIQNVKSNKLPKVQAIAKKMNHVNSLALKSRVLKIPSDFINLWVKSLNKLEQFDFSLELDDEHISPARRTIIDQKARSYFKTLRIHPNLQSIQIAIPNSAIGLSGFPLIFTKIPHSVKKLSIKDDYFQEQALRVLPCLKNLESFSFEITAKTDKQFIEDLFAQLSQLKKLSCLSLLFKTKASQQLNNCLKSLSKKKLLEKIGLNFGVHPYELEGLLQSLEGLDLTHFSLSVNIKSNHRLPQLTKFLNLPTKLQSPGLAIGHDSYSRKDRGLKDFVETVFNLESLKSLNFSLSTLSESSNAQHSIADFQPDLKKLFTKPTVPLESLSFLCTQDDLELFPNLLKSIQETKPDLRKLSLQTPSHYFEETRNETLINIIKELKNVHILKLDCFNISTRHILTETVGELTKLRYLRELDLSKIGDHVPFSAFVSGIEKLILKRGLRFLIVNNTKLEQITSPTTDIYLKPEQKSSPIQKMKLSQIRKINPSLEYDPTRQDLVIIEQKDREWISF